MDPDDYVAMIPGAPWCVVYTDSAMKPEPVLAFVMRRDGSIEPVDRRFEDPRDHEFFSHLVRRD